MDAVRTQLLCKTGVTMIPALQVSKPRSPGLPAEQALLGVGLMSRAVREAGGSHRGSHPSSRSSFIYANMVGF